MSVHDATQNVTEKKEIECKKAYANTYRKKKKVFRIIEMAR